MKNIISALCCLIIAASAGGAPAEKDVRRVPVIMYHSVCNTGVCRYVLSPEDFRADCEYLRAHGYETVFISDIVDFCDGKADLPPKPIVLTLDDGFYNNLYYVDEIAKEYGVKFTVSVVGAYIEKEEGERKRSPVYSYLNSAEIKTLHDGGRAEIANHSFDMHHSSTSRKGVRKKAGESAEEYEQAITLDSEKCRKLVFEACGKTMDVFTYPFGYSSRDTADIISRLGYRAILTCVNGINEFEKGSTRGLKSIMRYNRSGLIKTEEFFKKIGIS